MNAQETSFKDIGSYIIPAAIIGIIGYSVYRYNLDIVSKEQKLHDIRDICISSDNIICDYITLSDFSKKGDLLDVWWLLNKTERKNISISLIEGANVEYSIGGSVPQVCNSGLSSCAGIDPAFCGGTECGTNAGLRYLLLNEFDNIGIDTCYFIGFDNVTRCFYIPFKNKIKLPCTSVSVDAAETLFFHRICAIQIGEDVTDITNWIFFQYEEANIILGTGQIPNGTYITVFDKYTSMVGTTCHGVSDGYDSAGKYPAKWHLKLDGTIEIVNQ